MAQESNAQYLNYNTSILSSEAGQGSPLRQFKLMTVNYNNRNDNNKKLLNLLNFDRPLSTSSEIYCAKNNISNK